MFTHVLLTTLVHFVFHCYVKTENIQVLSFTVDSALNDFTCPANSVQAGEDSDVACAYMCLLDHTCDGFSYSKSLPVCNLCGILSAHTPARSLQGLLGATTYLLPCSREWESYGDSCYFIVTTPMSQANAQIYCGEHAIGGRLVYIETEGESNFITSMMLEKYPLGIGTAKIWIGAQDGNTNYFRWLDGTPLDNGFTNWVHQEPSNGNGENCLAARLENFTYGWTDGGCNKMYWCICETSL